MCLRRKNKGKSKVLSRGFRLRDSEAEQRPLRFLNKHCSVVKSYSLAHRSIKQNPRDRTLDLPFFFCYRHLTSLQNPPSAAPRESLPYWFRGNFAALFVLIYCLRKFLLSAFANRSDLRYEPKQLMLSYYKICPCSVGDICVISDHDLMEWIAGHCSKILDSCTKTFSFFCLSFRSSPLKIS